MEVSNAKPRVNFSQLRKFMGKKVLLVGEIQVMQNNTVRMKAADGGMVTVELTKGPHFDGGEFWEFEGVVQSPTSVKEESRTSYGDRFDLATYNEVCRLSCDKYTQVFL
ncbi:hypothetical protein WJX73_007296 [Symbiochloris irregularis]|uniref:Replication factor A protein 3 n=1 Tax=Symbiochloris irregularis TaxID=706552 RepID=A0AAW1PAB6_9CHLO